MEGLTELQNLDGKILAKRIERDASTGEVVTTPYDQGAMHFRVVQHAIGSIQELAAALERIGSSPASCVIRGAPRYPKLPVTLRRKSHFLDVPRLWSLHDLDGIELPPGLDWLANPEAAVRYAVGLMPVPFHDSTCWWAFSASQGFKPGLRLRLGFWHDVAVSGADLSIWLGEAVPEAGKPRRSWRRTSPVDTAVYRTVQPIYVARPIFGEGVADPVPRRSGLLVGRRDVVPVPVPILPRFSGAAVRTPRIKPEKASAPAGEVVTNPYEANGTGFAYHVETIGDGPGGRGFYEPLTAALASWMSVHGPNADAAAVLADLVAAARAAPRDPTKHSAEDVELRLSNLPNLLEWLRTEERRKADHLTVPGSLCDPKRDLPTMSLTEASAAVAAAVAGAFVEMLGAVAERGTLAASATNDDLAIIETAERYFDSPRRPRIGIGAGIGIGKTEVTLRALLRAVREDPALRVAYAVPTHVTADDACARLNALGGRTIAAVWRGTGRPDPVRPDRAVCLMHAVVDQVRAVGGRIRDVCGGPKAGWCCHNPRRPGQVVENACAYRQQFSPDVQVWFVPHAMLASAAPAVFMTAERMRIGAPFDMLVLDEAPWLSLLGGFGPRPTQVLVEDIVQLARWPAGIGDARSEYLDVARRLNVALAGQSGLLKRTALAEAGLSASVAARAEALAWRLMAPLSIRRDVPPEVAGLAVHEEGSANGAARFVVRFWNVLADFLRSPAEVAAWTLYLDQDGEGRPAITLRWKEEVHRHWSGGPILYLDATLVRPVAECWLPDLRIEAEVRAAETHVHRTATITKAFGKSSLFVANDDDDAEERRQARTVGQLVRYIEVLALHVRSRGRMSGVDVAVVTYEGLERRIRPHLPANVVTGHFNALRGFDGWGGVAAIVVIGRPEASPREVERLASVASGIFVPPIGGDWYSATDGVLLMRDGTGRSVRTYAHPDSRAEAFRQQILTELVQVEGRARSIRRRACDPLVSVIFTNTPTDLPLDAAEIEGELLDGVRTVAVLVARGIVPDTAADAAQVLPELCGESRDAASALRQRLGREGSGPGLAEFFEAERRDDGVAGEVVTSPYISYYRGLSRLRAGPLPEPLSQVPPKTLAAFECYRYRPQARRTGGSVLIDTAQHADPKAAFGAVVGPLASFVRAERPAWLATLRALFDPAEREAVNDSAAIVLRLPKSRTPLDELLVTDHRVPGASSPVPPVPDEMYRIERTGLDVLVHTRWGAVDLQHRRMSDACWPPRQDVAAPIIVQNHVAISRTEAGSEPTMTAFDIAAELGTRPHALMVGPEYKRLERQHGREKALAYKLIGKFGAPAVQAAGARYLAKAEVKAA